MGFSKLSFLAILCVLVLVVDAHVSFDDNYKVDWGSHHIDFLNQGTDVQLLMDKSSGSGFGSKLKYGSGFFHMRIKLHKGDTAGIITAFYLISNSSHHDEVDLEFLGNTEDQPVVLQTNVFANGTGNREQRIRLWFDPSESYHTYKVLWNPHQIVIYVDDVPIRVYKNLTKQGVNYPRQPMRIEASLWQGEWASVAKTNWSLAPFTAQFQGFDVDGCRSPRTSRDGRHCNDPKYWWNGQQYWKLSATEKKEMEIVREKFMNYDYCTDKVRNPVTPPECAFNK